MLQLRGLNTWLAMLFFVLHAAPWRTLVAEEDLLAPLEVIKASYFDEPTSNNVSLLAGFQIRPPQAWLKVGQTQLFVAKNCFGTSFQREKDELVTGTAECDPSGVMMAPLLEVANTSRLAASVF